MLTNTGIIFSGIFLCLIGCFFAFSLISRKGAPSFKLPFFCISFFICCSILIFGFFSWSGADFISNISLSSFIAPAIILFVLTLITLAPLKQWFQLGLLFICCIGIVFGFDLCIVFSGSFPHTVNSFLTALCWFSICCFPQILNINSGLISIQTLTLSLGGLLLYFIDALPLALGFLSACIAACSLAFLISGRQNMNLQLSDQMSNLLGFLLGWLVIYASLESAGSCFLVFAIYPLIEIVFSLCQKLTFLPHFAIIKNNTLYMRITDSEMTPSIINRHLFRISAICILFGSFQAFSPNNYSIPLFCFLVVLWQLYRIYNWREISYSLKETNQKFIRDVKENLQEISQTLKNKRRK